MQRKVNKAKYLFRVEAAKKASFGEKGGMHFP